MATAPRKTRRIGVTPFLHNTGFLKPELKRWTAEHRRSHAEAGAARRMFTDTEKWCPKCESWLPHGAFNASRQSASGLQAYCRDCMRTYVREYKRKVRSR